MLPGEPAFIQGDEKMRIAALFWFCFLWGFVASCPVAMAVDGPLQPGGNYGWRLAESNEEATLWWASSGWKIGRAWAPPEKTGGPLLVRAARN